MPLLPLIVAVAAAQEAPPDEAPDTGEADAPGDTITIPPVDEEAALPSALDDGSAISYPDEPAGIAGILDAWKGQRRGVWGASTFVRPTLSMRFGAGIHPLQLGFVAGRRWWQLRPGPGLALQVQGHGDFALAGGAGSYDLGLTALGGPWLTIVGLQVGPALGVSRIVAGRVELAAVGGVDAWALLTVDARVLHLFGGAAPRWLLADARAGARDDHPLPGFGDEFAVRAGAGFTLSTLRLTGDWTRRWTALGVFDRVGIGFRFRLL